HHLDRNHSISTGTTAARMCYIAGHFMGTAGRRDFLLALLAFTAISRASLSAQDEGLRVVPLVRDAHVLVSFDLKDGFTDEVRAAIRSGLKTTFTYDVELRLDVPGWVDRTIGTTTITSSVEYSNLRRDYRVIRMVDGRVDEERTTEDEATVRRW